jgi:hypothetical protein
MSDLLAHSELVARTARARGPVRLEHVCRARAGTARAVFGDVAFSRVGAAYHACQLVGVDPKAIPGSVPCTSLSAPSSQSVTPHSSESVQSAPQPSHSSAPDDVAATSHASPPVTSPSPQICADACTAVSPTDSAIAAIRVAFMISALVSMLAVFPTYQQELRYKNANCPRKAFGRRTGDFDHDDSFGPCS